MYEVFRTKKTVTSEEMSIFVLESNEKQEITEMEQQERVVRKKKHVSTIVPRRYNVILHNDDFTTMDFVVMILETVFHRGEKEAEEIMMQVHQTGKGIAGTYSYDIATTKADKATRMAREENFPLQLTVEPA